MTLETSTTVVMRASSTPMSTSSTSGSAAPSDGSTACSLRQVPEVVAAHRGRVATRSVRELGRPHTDSMDLDVVGMAVATALVVGGEHLGMFLVEDRGQAPRRFLDVGGPERSLGVVGRQVDHARVAVAEELHASDTEDLSGADCFFGAPFAELLRRFEHAVVDLAEIAARREHEHHAMAGVGRERERASRQDGFVVRMRVEGNERAGHSLHGRTPSRESRNATASPAPFYQFRRSEMPGDAR